MQEVMAWLHNMTQEQYLIIQRFQITVTQLQLYDLTFIENASDARDYNESGDGAGSD